MMLLQATGSGVTSPLAGEGKGGGAPMHRDGAQGIRAIPSVTDPAR